MALAFRRGLQAAEEASEKGGSGFRPFAPEIRWQDDKESKYVLILTPVDELVTIQLHEWIPVGTGQKANGEAYTKYEWFMSRKDPAIGEDFDKLEDELEATPRERTIGVAVELEPVMEVVRGRQKPKGFSVKTDTFTSNGDDGEKEVTFPIIGTVTQSYSNFWGPLGSLDESRGPLSALPVEIKRVGKNKDTRYDSIPFDSIDIDLSPLLDNVDGISYLREEFEELAGQLENAEDDQAAAVIIAEALLMRRLEELADSDRYEELTGHIKEPIPSKFGGKKKKSDRPARPSRQSPRAAKAEEAPEESGGGEPEEAPQAEEKPASSRSARFAKLRAQVES